MNEQGQNNTKKNNVYDVVVKDEARNGRTYWRTVGVAFPLNNGSPGFSLRLHMFPSLNIYVKESLRPSSVTSKEQAETDNIPF